MASRYNAKGIKAHRSYTVIEAAKALNKHPKTIRNWIKAGLPVVDENRPLLISGIDLKIFLSATKKNYAHQCEMNESFCFKCKQPTKPCIESLQFIAKPAGMAQMKGCCNECGYQSNKFVSWRDVQPIWLSLGGKLPIAEKHLILRGKALENLPFDTEINDEKE